MNKADVNVEFKPNFVSGHICTVTHVPSNISTTVTHMDRQEALRRAMKTLNAHVLVWERKHQDEA